MVDFWDDETLDLWKVTRAKTLWRNKAEVFQLYHDYPVMNQWFAKDKVMEKGGTKLTWQALIDDAGNARFTNPYETRDYNSNDVWGAFEAPWRLCDAYYQVTKDEIGENTGSAEQLQNLLDGKRTECACGIANLLEEWAWKCPAGETDAEKDDPYGVEYSVVIITGAQVTANATNRFRGANNANMTSCYGVDSSAAKYERYRNFNDFWTNASGDITEDDVDKICRMLRQLKWTGPINAREFESAAFDNLRLYTVDTLIVSAERKARANNDSLGADLGKYAGNTVTKGIPWIWSEGLETVSGSTYPLMAIDHNSFVVIVHKDEYMAETGPKRLERQHRVMVTDVDLKFQFVNRNRRRCGRIDYVAAG